MSNDNLTTSDDAEKRLVAKRAACKAWRDRNKDRIAAYNKEWQAANRDEKAAQQAARRRADPELYRARDRANRESRPGSCAARQKAYRERHPEKVKLALIEYRRANPEKVNAKKRRSYHRNSHSILLRAKCRKYGLTIEQYEEMSRACKGRCSCCGVVFSKILKERECVDHCHKTGRVRGILCHRCNLLIGMANDDSRVLRSLARYLDRAEKDSRRD